MEAENLIDTVVLITVKVGHAYAVAETLEKVDKVDKVLVVTGPYDIVVLAELPAKSDYKPFINAIHEIDGGQVARRFRLVQEVKTYNHKNMCLFAYKAIERTTEKPLIVSAKDYLLALISDLQGLLVEAEKLHDSSQGSVNPKWGKREGEFEAQIEELSMRSDIEIARMRLHK